MTKKRVGGISRTLLNIFLTIPAIFRLGGSIFTEALLEIQNLRKKMIFLLALTVVCLVLFLGVWVCSMGLLLLYLLSVQMSLMLSLSLILALNLLLLIIVLLITALIRRDLALRKTRHALKSFLSEL